LRIGYLSSDFQEHPTSRLIAELFEQHDRSRFEIYAYSYGKDDGGKMRTRIAGAVDRFYDIRMTADHNTCKHIERDGVDILVDLKGYTESHRLSLMALRPAPIQIHYLGFPGTTGAPFIDYFISDPVASPQGADELFSECLIRLPHSYQINDRKRALPENALPRSAYGLPDGAFIFGEFNNAYKITRDVFNVWMRLLVAVEGSVLWLYEKNPEATANLRREAEKQGVNPSRIVPALPLPQSEHLQRYRHADLFLDTSPVCGHTTASDALWCGVPVVAIAADSFISRVAASLLCAVGLSELVTTDLAAYEALALALARDPKRLEGLRRHLEEGRMRFPLFDSLASTRALEAAYAHAAKLHRSGHAPQAFTLPLPS
jgi:predicted O-linked N-acetylglucosamine transferase (SPINDLY family)